MHAVLSRKACEPSAIVDAAQRVDKSRSWGYKYRESFERAWMIEVLGDGKMAFALPCFGEYLARTR